MSFDLEKIRAKLEAIPDGYENKVARIGFFPGAVYEDGTPVAYVAAIQEFGAPEASIPSRPFMRPSIEEHKSEWVDQMAAGIRKAINGSTTADQVLFSVGALAASNVQETIQSTAYEGLSPVTILLRKWRREGRHITGKTVGEAAAAIYDAMERGEDILGGTNADPLRDTGLLIASIRNDVESE